jgi:protein-tyrosine phosphatase
MLDKLQALRLRRQRASLAPLPTTTASAASSTGAHTSGFSWVLPGQLAVGRLPQLSDRPRFNRHHISAIVSLCSDAEGTLPDEIRHSVQYAGFPLPDSRYQTRATLAQIQPILKHIHSCIQQRQIVYVHCLAGVERSPMICAAYLCQYHALSAWESITYLTQQHPNTCLTEAQYCLVQAIAAQAAASG